MASDTGGAKPFSIQGRLARERERLLGMSDKERAWRRQWIKDQELSPNEPRYVPEYYKERYNPIRRAYKMPLDIAFKPLIPVLVCENNMNSVV
jgi:NADH dehydrogenase (ubiquinone) 1 beta subcomplex subunit 6